MPIDSCLASGHHWEESVSLFFIPSDQGFLHIDKITLNLLSCRPSSYSCLMKAAPSPLSSLRPFTELSPVSPHLSFTGEPSTWSSIQVWPDQWWAEGKNHLPQPAGNPFLMSFRGSWPSLWHGCIPGSQSASCLQRPPPGPLLQTCLPAGHLPVCTDSEGYSSPGTGLCTSLCWTA